jgi:hypothetical protein
MSRTIATARLYASLLWLVVAALLAALREVLPSTEDELAPWFGGFCTSFVLHWVMLILVTWLWSISR